MEFRDVLSAIFSKTEWGKVTDKEKYSYFFVINRMLSIKYPAEINSCQIIGLGGKNSARMLDCWNVILSSKFTRVPSWVYCKSSKKETSKDVLKDIKNETLTTYINKHELGSKDFDYLVDSSPDILRKELLALQKSLSL